jgi:hypothetical protein
MSDEHDNVAMQKTRPKRSLETLIQTICTQENAMLKTEETCRTVNSQQYARLADRYTTQNAMLPLPSISAT